MSDKLDYGTYERHDKRRKNKIETVMKQYNTQYYSNGILRTESYFRFSGAESELIIIKI